MKTILPIEILPIEDDGFHLKVAIKINGKKSSLILDTGASRTVFDANSIGNFVDENEVEEQERLSSGIGTTTMASKKVMLKKIQLGKVVINDYSAAVIDLTHVNQSYEKLELEPVDGVLGGDILIDYKAIINYDKKELVLTL